MLQRKKRKVVTRFKVLLTVAASVVVLATVAAYRQELRDFTVDDTQYAEQIHAAASRHNLDPLLVRALIFQESRFRADTIGAAGEIGLMQILPRGAVADWARHHGVAPPSRSELMHPELNLEIGCYYLARAMNRWRNYRCMMELALCQYNAGEVRTNQWKPKHPDGDALAHIPLASTQAYVRNIMQRYQQYQKDRKR